MCLIKIKIIIKSGVKTAAVKKAFDWTLSLFDLTFFIVFKEARHVLHY